MKKISLIIFFCSLFISCDTTVEDSADCSTYDYSDCNTKEPKLGYLSASLSKNPNGGPVIISLYKGKYNHQASFYSDTITETTFNIALDVDEYYSAVVRYTRGKDTIFVVDGDKITRTENIKCDSSCWEVNNASLNLRISQE